MFELQPQPGVRIMHCVLYTFLQHDHRAAGMLQYTRLCTPEPRLSLGAGCTCSGAGSCVFKAAVRKV